MTKKHRFYFLIWKLKMFLKGFTKDAPVRVWSSEKNKFIKGYIQYFSGCSITKEKFGFDIIVRFLEPIQGNDARYYASGIYSEKEISK